MAFASRHSSGMPRNSASVKLVCDSTLWVVSCAPSRACQRRLQSPDGSEGAYDEGGLGDPAHDVTGVSYKVQGPVRIRADLHPPNQRPELSTVVGLHGSWEASRQAGYLTYLGPGKVRAGFG